MSETWTIKKLLDWTTEYFKKYNIEWPHLEAEILLSHTLNVPRIQLYVQFERTLKEDELAKYKQLILRRAKREPIAYITGYQPFMSLNIKVSPAVLIPRPETEKLVEVTIEHARTLEKPLIADLGTGSGAIIVSLAKYLPEAKFYGTDSSSDAIEIAKENAKTYGVADRCNFLAGDLLEPLEDVKGKLDIIVSNPPYIKSNEIDKLQPEIKFEPRLSLDGGEDGLKYYRMIIEKADAYLKKGGSLILEVGYDQTKAVSKIILDSKKYADPKTYKDNSGIERVISVGVF